MGKKQKNRVKSYTITQFIEIICKQCKHCSNQGVKKVKAEFCFPIFRSNPWGFCENTIPRIKKISKCKLSFEDIFCKECDLIIDFGVESMPPRCKNLIACIDSFKKQTGQILIKGNDLKINTYVAATKDLKEVTKKKEPYRISVAYPTMFHSTADPEWEDFIRKTVEGAYIDHSDNNIKQDNNTEPSGST